MVYVGYEVVCVLEESGEDAHEGLLPMKEVLVISDLVAEGENDLALRYKLIGVVVALSFALMFHLNLQLTQSKFQSAILGFEDQCALKKSQL